VFGRPILEEVMNGGIFMDLMSIKKRASFRTMLIVILTILLASVLAPVSGQGTHDTTTTGEPTVDEECAIVQIITVFDENGDVIENYTMLDDADGLTDEDEPNIVELTDMGKSIDFVLEITHEEAENMPNSTTGSTNELKLKITFKNSENWNITWKFDEKVKIVNDDAVFYLEDDELSVKHNFKNYVASDARDRELILHLEPEEKVRFTVSFRPLSSASPGEHVELVIQPDKPQGWAGCGSAVPMIVKITEENEYDWTMFVGVAAALIGIGFAFYLRGIVMDSDRGPESVRKISDYIHEGAMAFLNKEYRILLIFTAGVTLVLVAAAAITDAMSYWTALTFVVGAIFSAVAGNIGMRIATAANGRTAVAVKKDLLGGLRIAFSSGAVMGLSVVSLGLLGVSIFYLIFRDPNILFGFGFGASSIALFARVGGGIYTKSADVGADLVGKVEKSIPEDDPRNPATIADNVGDNVGDVAGMGADLFESYVDSIIAAMILGLVGVSVYGGFDVAGGFAGKAVLLPMIIAGIGIISSVIGIVIVNSASESKNPHSTLNTGIFGAAIIQAIASFILIWLWLGWEYYGLWGAMIAGLVSGIVIGLITEYYTSDEFKPTKGVAESSKTGAATNIISGLSLGMFSTVVPVLTVCVALVAAYWFAGLYGIALAAVGMLSTLGITLATDSYGPVADNAAGFAEMAGMGKSVRERAEKLDAVGNTTAAIGKGFAIGSAALTALALFSTYTQATHLTLAGLSLMDPYVITGVFVGALLVFVFSALTMSAVGKAAIEMVEEVRRQFKEIKGLMKGKVEPDYKKCVEIATGGALRQMIFPSLLAVIAPVAVGLLLGPEALGGLLAGAVVVGFLMAIMMANSGGAWDNAKKYVESGHLGGKGSNVHKAAVVGDTVGDPFKDTSGPALNILIKLMSIVSLVFAPLFLLLHG